MAKSIKGSKTEQNLLKAFAGESQARNRYTYFSSAARKEGFEQIANIFQETADNEKEHAKVFFSHLEGGDLEITAAYPAERSRTRRRTSRLRQQGRRWSGRPSTPISARSPATRDIPRWPAPSSRSQRPRSSTNAATASSSTMLPAARSSREDGGEMALHQLRLRLRRHRASQGMPRMQASAVILRGSRRELLGHCGIPRICLLYSAAV